MPLCVDEFGDPKLNVTGFAEVPPAFSVPFTTNEAPFSKFITAPGLMVNVTPAGTITVLVTVCTFPPAPTQVLG